MRRFTLAQMFERGYSLSEIDHMIAQGFATYGSKSGATTLNVQDIMGVDEYFADMRDNQSRRRR